MSISCCDGPTSWWTYSIGIPDRVESCDRRAVEAHPVVERLFDLARCDGETFEVSLDIGEPKQQEVDVLVLQPFQGLAPRLRVARRPRPALDLRHAKTSLKRQKPQAPGA